MGHPLAYMKNMFCLKKFSIYSLFWIKWQLFVEVIKFSIYWLFWINWHRFVEVKEILAFIPYSGLIGIRFFAFWQSQSILIFRILLGQMRKSFFKQKRMEYKIAVQMSDLCVVSTHILHKRFPIRNKWPFLKTLY